MKAEMQKRYRPFEGSLPREDAQPATSQFLCGYCAERLHLAHWQSVVRPNTVRWRLDLNARNGQSIVFQARAMGSLVHH